MSQAKSQVPSPCRRRAIYRLKNESFDQKPVEVEKLGEITIPEGAIVHSIEWVNDGEPHKIGEKDLLPPLGTAGIKKKAVAKKATAKKSTRKRTKTNGDKGRAKKPDC